MPCAPSQFLVHTNLRDQLLGQLGKSLAARLPGDNLHHLLSDCANLRALGIGGLLNLVWSLLGEGNDEHAEEVVVSGLDNSIGLDEGLPLADQ